MTLTVEYDGEDITGLLRLADGVQGLTSAADGQFESAPIKIDDPDGTRDIVPWQLLTADEDDCELPRIWTGYLFSEDLNRNGVNVVGAGRDHHAESSDLNILLHMQPARGSTAKRPQETGNARLAWLLSSVCLDGLVFDDGLVGDNPNLFDAADYNESNSYADEILGDLCVSSSDDEPGRIFFVKWNQALNHPELFIDVPTAAVYDSDIAISNVIGDVDNVDVFYPASDATLTRSAEEIFCSVFFGYKTGKVFRHNDATHAAVFGDNFINHRQAVFSTSRVGSLETAERHADQFLANHSAARDKIVCQVVLPSTKVNCLDIGMRMQVKFSHLGPPYDDWTYTRVQRRTVVLDQNPERVGFYLLQLELSMKGFGDAAGGPPTTDFPAPPPGPPAIVQDKFAAVVAVGPLSGTIPLDAAPTAGNWLVVAVASRGSGITLPGTFTEHPHGVITPGSDFGRLGWRVVGAGETADVLVTTASGTWAHVWEVSGITGTALTTSFADTDTGTQPASINAGTLSPTAGLPVAMFMVLVMHCSDYGGNGPTSMTTPSGWTLDGEFEVANPGELHPAVQANSQIVSATSGTYGTVSTIAGAGFNFGGWGGLAVAFAGSAEVNPPASGQIVEWTTVVMSPSGGVSVGTTAFPYAPTSLQVKVDGVLISPASYTETDSATGDFALSWLLDGDETVLVKYLGL